MTALVVEAMSGMGGMAAQAALPGVPAPGADVLQLFLGSGWVVRLVLFTLVGFSVGCWGIALAKSADMRRARRQSDRFEDIFWGEKKLSVIQSASVDMRDSP